MQGSPTSAATPHGRVARERFVAHIEAILQPLVDAIRARLIELTDGATSTREMHELRDVLMDFERDGGKWAAATAKAWRRALVPPTATARVRMEMINLELIGDDVMENKILSSRLAMAIQEKAVWDLNELKVRIQHLEGGETEFATEDVLRPEAMSQLMVEQWGACGLKRPVWLMVKDVVHAHMVGQAVEGYRSANQYLIDQGVLRDIDLSAKVRHASSPPRKPPAAPAAPEDTGNSTGSGPASRPGALGARTGGGNTGGGGYGGQGGFGGGPGGGGQGGGYGSGPGGYGGGQGHGGNSGGAGSAGGGYSGGGGGGYGGGPGGPGGGSAGGGYGAGHGGGGGSGGGGGAFGGAGAAGGVSPGAYGDRGGGGGGVGGPQGGGGPAGAAGYSGGVADETRMMTSSPPLARAKARASGVIGQLKRLLTDKVAGFDVQRGGQPSPALAAALTQHAEHVQTHVHTHVQTRSGDGGEIVEFDDADVEVIANDLRTRTSDLKKKASTSSEKATIEIVALMFQSILAEERIPAAVRVWFARLQMPVLRVAIAEPEFFGTLEHPARQLIDRMGSCVLGFDAVAISGSAMETEIKRVVQVIEQYPETGRRVFQLVYEEFQRFLSKYLTEKGSTQKLVSVAQQVEQKETMAIQYTIELRKMLADIPVRDEIREYLFKVWAEVLAVAAVKNGPQHEETIALKKSASDLVWAASAKPNRQERARVIQDLPKLLLRLRQGMTLLGLQGPVQEQHIKQIGDTLADAFLSKTEAIPQARIEEMAKRLANLEDFVADDPEGDLPLDQEHIELMLGIDASSIEVIADGGSMPNAAMLGWAHELQLGNWFTLDHNGAANHVQYVWRSERRQLHLLAASDGRSFLIQLRRLAAYLQAGLLLPTEEEALTVRATREALAKLDANPERLLA